MLSEATSSFWRNKQFTGFIFTVSVVRVDDAGILKEFWLVVLRVSVRTESFTEPYVNL